MNLTLGLGCATLVACLACGCAAKEGAGPSYPAQPDGCAIETFPDVPPKATENIGPVSANCDETVSNAECLRTLKDQACKLGADVIWGVDENPPVQSGRKKLSGRAAHTKAGGK